MQKTLKSVIGSWRNAVRRSINPPNASSTTAATAIQIFSVRRKFQRPVVIGLAKIISRVVVQPRAEPAFHFGQRLAFALRQIGNLIFAEFADGEIF